LILVVLSGFLNIVGMVALWFRLSSVSVWSDFAWFSFVSAVVSLVFVVFSLVFIKSRFRGLVERFMVTPYQFYYFAISLMVFLTN
jgi:hypothetical protein